MQQHSTRVCILGGGPAALLCEVLLRQRGVDTLVVAKSLFGMLAPIESNGIRFTPVPVFTNSESNLFRRMAWGPLVESDILRVHHVDVPQNGGAGGEIRSGSYAEFLVGRYDRPALPLALARKHLGPVIFEDALPELRRKVSKHYPRDAVRAERVGFSEGLSPYLIYLERNPPRNMLRGSVQAIDVQRRRVVTDVGIVAYERLIATMPLLDCLRLTGIATSLTVQAGAARFVILGSDAGPTPNQMIYDCNTASPVYRAFVPRPGIITVQVTRSQWEAPLDALVARTRELFALTRSPSVLSSFNVEQCYPLAVSNYESKRNMIDELERAGITLFGRFAQWEYCDLDELDWERLG